MTTPMASTNGAQPATFSYAQAAKGKSVTSASAPPASQEESVVKGTEQKPKQTISNHEQLTNSSWADDATDAVTVVDDQTQTGPKVEQSSPRLDGMVNGALNSASSYATSMDAGASQSTGMARDEDGPSPITPDADELSWRRKTSGTEDALTDKGGLGTPDQQCAAETTEAKPAHLVEAPAPAVNIWTQRAQEAKTKQGSEPSHPMKANDSFPKPTGPSSNAVRSNSPPTRGESSSKTATASGRQVDDFPTFERETRGFGGPRGGRAAARNSVSASIDNGPRRTSRQASISTGTQFPSLQDTMSWPTPETVQDGDRKKAHERAGENRDSEKPATGTGKSHGKQEWKPVPFVPTVKFETPISNRPGRGARGGARGGRDSMSRGGISSSARGPPNSQRESGRVGLSRDRSASGTERASSLPRHTPNQSSGGSQSGLKRTSLPSEVLGHPTQDLDISSAGESLPVKAHSTDASAFLSGHFANDNSAMSIETSRGGAGKITDGKPRRRASRATDAQEFGGPRNGERRRSGSLSSTVKSNWPDRRTEGGGKEHSSSHEANNPLPFRERGDGRPERGRGGRNRGGLYHSHSPANLQITSGQTYLPPTPHSAKSATFNGTFSGGSSGYRGGGRGGHGNNGPRSATIPTETTFGRYPAQFANSYYFPHQYMSPAPSFDSAPMTPSGSSIPMVNMMLMNGVASQLSYYFSVDNLCKDMFLRERMDSQGFVSLRLISNFQRLQSMTVDFELIKSIAQQNPELEVYPTSNGDLLVRKREGWMSFVLAMNQRDASAQNDGPNLPSYYSSPIQINGYDQAPAANGQFPGFNPVPTETPVNNYSRSPNGRHAMPATNSPYDPAAGEQARRQSGQQSNSEREPDDESDSYPDDKINSELTILTRFRPDQLPHPQFSRTFSNGTIDGSLRSPKEQNGDYRSQSPAVTNDADSRYDALTLIEQKKGPKHQLTPISDRTAKLAEIKEKLSSPVPGHRNPNSRPQSSAVFWIKDQQHSVELPQNAMSVPYARVYESAKHQRRNAEPAQCPPDMVLLYDFWSHFLLRNYNKKMYDDFRVFAFEDANNGSHLGIDHLFEYYSKALFSADRPIRRSVAQDFVNQVRYEDAHGDRPAFKRLRTAWRNGEMNIKSRKILQDVMEPDLKASLDR
ncbi:MAG: hypothetical protein Q9162_007347 [Coniocarpon cinnabarinum]